MTHRPTALLLGCCLAMSTIAHADALTLERIFSDPDLSGTTPRLARLTPDGERVTYLKGRESDSNLLDLWVFDIESGEHRKWIDAREVQPEAVELSAEEAARRERQRIADLRGIVDYRVAGGGRFVLFPLGGDIHVLDTESGDGGVRQITDSEAFDTDPQVAPGGENVAFIRGQDLWIANLETGRTSALTTDGEGTISNGVAEFIAQEEMGRDTGYWWSPDGDAIAFLQVDEAPVEVARRYEVTADDIQIVEQRYPYTGTPNVNYRLGVVDIESGETEWIDLGNEDDLYIPRVKWLPGGEQLAYQRQSRNQKTLELVFVNIANGMAKTVITETSETWVDLHDDLHFVSGQDAFIWSSRRDGHNHLYLLDHDGGVIRRLTAGDWSVDALVGVDDVTGMIYFTAAEKSPVEKHLYRQSLVTETPEAVSRITRRPGFHDIAMSGNARVYIDTFSSIDQPPQVSLHRTDGERLHWLAENRVAGDHPYAPFMEGHRPTRFGTLEAEDGQSLHYRITLPPDHNGGGRHPVFMYVYGGPTSQTVTNSWGRRILVEQYMARHGFVVFSLDNRGTPRRGTAFQAPAYLELGRVEVTDQATGVEYLRGLDFVDPERIGIFGWSYGGYMALMTLMQNPELYAAGVSVAPVTDWRLYDTHYTERYLGTPQEHPEAYEQGDVVTYADNLADPLLLIHGMADDNVLFTHSTRLMKALQDAGKPFELMTYPGAKHGISGQQSQLHVYRMITRFFVEKLGADGRSENQR